MPADTTTLAVRNDLKEVARAGEFLTGLWKSRGLPEDPGMDATLALEEILSNVIRHGCEPACDYDIKIRFTFTPDSYEIEVSDDAVPYNPLLRPDPDLDLPIEQRGIGGLGIFLVKKLADELRYDYRDGRNHLVFRKKLPV